MPLTARRLTWFATVRLEMRDLNKKYDKTEDDLKAIQNVGQIIGEVLKQLTEEKCMGRSVHAMAVWVYQEVLRVERRC